jgi:hypothetical protein
MSIASTTNRNDYVGNGAVDTYAYGFRIFAKTDLRVTVQDTAEIPVRTTLVVDTDYTVSGVGDDGGGSIALVNSGQSWLDADGDLKSGYALTIRRVRPLKQETDIRNQGDFYPEAHEDAFDHLVMIEQQQQDELDRCLRLPETEAGSGSFVLPSEEERAGNFLAFDDDGNPIVAAGVTDVTVSAFMETVLDDATASDALTTLGVSTFIKTLLDDSSAAIARATLGFSGAGGTAATANLEDASVTLAKHAALAANSIIGNNTGGAATPVALTATQIRTLLGVVQSNTSVAIFNETQAGSAGTFTAGAWQTRTLDTTNTSQSWASLLSNQVTLTAGTYVFEASAPAYRVDNHQSRIQNITDASTAVLGTTDLSVSSASYATTRSFCVGTVTIASSKVFELQHRCTTTKATDGFGPSAGIGSEVYSVLKITKVA